MANTYVAIATVTVGSGGSNNITFSSIPATYTDLLIKASIRGSYSAATIAFRLNPNSSTSSMASRVLYGDGASPGSFSDTIAYGNTTADSATASTFGSLEYYISNYTGSNSKPIGGDGVTENNATSAVAYYSASLWSSSSVISSIEIVPTIGTILQHSTATLYGIKKS